MARLSIAGVFAMLLMLAPETARSDSGNPLPATDDQWRLTIAFPMIWAPEINGKIRGEESMDFTIEFSDILESLSFGFMGEIYANKGPYGFVFRTNYMRVENDMSRTGLVDINAQTELTMGVNDLLASFRVHDRVRLVTGVRHVFAKLDLNVQTSIGDNEILNEQVTVTDDNSYDLLFGINLSHWFTDRWGIMLNSDVGVVGDNDRDISIEFRALVRVSDLNNFWFGLRYLNIGNDTHTDDVDVKVDMSQLGPTVGWAFTF
jgi:hypothetical protein